MRKELGEIFVGVLHDDVEEIHAGELATAVAEKLKQVRVRELRDALPDGQLVIGSRDIGRNEFNSGFARCGILELREEDSTVIGAPEETEQRILIVDKTTFALFPNF